jgi:hypothetical protein
MSVSAPSISAPDKDDAVPMGEQSMCRSCDGLGGVYEVTTDAPGPAPMGTEGPILIEPPVQEPPPSSSSIFECWAGPARAQRSRAIPRRKKKIAPGERQEKCGFYGNS